jgi:hypothetical protein
MTAPSSRPTQCPHCKHDNQVETYETITSHDRQLREKLVSGALWSWRCARCAKNTVSLYPVLYHDMRAWCMIYYLDRRMTDDPRIIERMVPAAEQLTALRRFNASYRFRLCRSLDDFIEKIRIFEAGLDDRAIEYLKLRNRSRAENGPTLTANGARKMMTRISSEGRFERVLDGESKRLDFALSPFSSTPEERELHAEIAFSEYKDALSKVNERLGSQPDLSSGFLIIDQSYVAEQLAEDGPKRQETMAPGKESAGNMGAVVFGKTQQSETRKPWWRFW